MNLMQPEISYERGYCRPECNDCSQVCPTGAIHPITAADKSSTQIGHAVWIKANCVSLTDGVKCDNCTRHCPTGAIQMIVAEPEKEASVLIVAPYKPHVARINQLVKLEYHNRGFKENLNFIRAGTIHSFQGSEADIVIFDLVIDEPHWKANLFMTD